MRSERLRPGFALPAVLAVTGVVTIIFLVAMTALYSLTSEAASARARVRFLQQAMSAEAALSYMVATEPMSARGVNIGAARSQFDSLDTAEEGGQVASGQAPAEVRLDGRPYVLAINGLIVGLRDQAGMINLSYLSPAQMSRLLVRLGVSGDLAMSIGPRYLDYVDVDDLRRPGGAESSDYAGVGASGPANRRLRRASEWLSLLGARRAIDGSRWRTLKDDLVVDANAVGVNVNTASPAALAVLFGADARQAEGAARIRDLAPFVSLPQFIGASGVPAVFDDEGIYTFPSGGVWATLRDTHSPWVYRSRITLTPSGQERPLWIDQTDMLEAPRRQPAEVKNVPGFPYAPR